jgi:hypothetical protein
MTASRMVGFFTRYMDVGDGADVASAVAAKAGISGALLDGTLINVGLAQAGRARANPPKTTRPRPKLYQRADQHRSTTLVGRLHDGDSGLRISNSRSIGHA